MIFSKLIATTSLILLAITSLGASTLSFAETNISYSNLDNYLICSEGLSRELSIDFKIEHHPNINEDSYTFPNGETVYFEKIENLGNNLFLVIQDVDGFKASGIINVNGDWLYSTETFFGGFNQQAQVKPLIYDASTQTTYFTTFEKAKYGVVTTKEEKDAAITILGVLLSDCMDTKDAQRSGLFQELIDTGFMVLAVKNNQIGIVTIDKNYKISVKKYYDSIEPIYTYDISLAQIKTKDESQIFTGVEDVLYKVKENGKYGLMDRDYNIRIPIQYDNLTRMDDFIAVTLDGKKGLLTTHGEPYIDIDYDYISPIYYQGKSDGFSNNIYDDVFFIIHLMKDNQLSLTDYFGNEFFSLVNGATPVSSLNQIDGIHAQAELDGTMTFSHQTEQSGREGVIDLVNQKILLPAIYSKVSQEMPNNTYVAILEGKRVLINENGEVLSDKLPNVYSLYTALNATNHILITIFDEHQGMIKDTSDEHQGVIDTKGNIVIPIIYDSIELYMFDDEVGYKATLNQEDTFFDSKGVSREPQ